MSGTSAGARKGWETRRGRLRGEAEHAASVRGEVRAAEAGNISLFRKTHQASAKTARASGRLGQEARHLELANAAAARERVLADQRRRQVLAHEERIRRFRLQLDQMTGLPKVKRGSSIDVQRKRAAKRLREAIAGERAAIAEIRRSGR